MAEAAEDLGTGENTSWTESFSDEHKESLSGFESQEKLFEAINYKVPEVEAKDWREGLSDDLKKTADRYASREDAIRSIQESRKRESLVRVPGKDATDDDKAAYHKAIGVPETSEGYEFKLAEGVESTPEIEASNKVWAERMHETKTSVESFNKFVGWMNEDVAAAEEAQAADDATYVKESEEDLKAEWKGDDYEKNTTLANKAFTEVANRAGINLEELKTIETKSGRFLMDDPRMLKLFSVVGREMSEGTLGSTLSEGERDTMDDQVSEIQAKIDAAQAAGNSKEADKLYQRKLALIGKRDGDKPIS